ncbi:hypothetical protein [Kineosporia sp. A_224]|uniref:hypothetical protein n=1 Tax=Kineosporia sp. A_224 TaxID=1962180 RepID=UPI000B4A7B4D|nr:hypothetical protein [Kineosporia sp. A_224]
MAARVVVQLPTGPLLPAPPPVAGPPQDVVWRLAVRSETASVMVAQTVTIAQDGEWELRTRVDVAAGAARRRRQVQGRVVLDLDGPGGGRVVLIGRPQTLARTTPSAVWFDRGTEPGLGSLLPLLRAGGRAHHGIATSTRRHLFLWSTEHDVGPTTTWGARASVRRTPPGCRAAPGPPHPSR